MGTKQLRLTDTVQIRNRIGSLTGKSVSIVLLNSTTLTGVLESLSNAQFVIRNMRLKKQTFPLDQIAELYFDSIV